MPVDPASRRRHLLIVVGVALAMVGALAWLQFTGRFDPVVEFFRALGPAPFFVAMTALPIFGFPISVFTVASGPLFGPTLGAAHVIGWAILAETINMTICYWLAARVLHGWARRRVERLGYTLPTAGGGTGWELTLLARIIPGIPFFVQNYLLGLARVHFVSYLAISTVIHGLQVTGTVLLGDAVMRRDPRTFAIGAVVLVFGAIAVYRIRRRLVKKPAPTAERI